MSQYLNNTTNQIFCIDDYGVEGEIFTKKWYEKLSENDKVYTIKNEWNEIQTYSKNRFRLQKQNLPNGSIN